MKAKKDVRIPIRVDAETAARLEQRSEETGVPIAEFVRRAIRLAEFADEQPSRKRAGTPVLFTPRQETR
jgi:hypothetical protein